MAVIRLVETIDEHAERRLGSVVPVGPRLALEVLDDGMARQPNSQQRLIARGVQVLDEPVASDLADLTRMLLRYADIGDTQRQAVSDAIRAALSRGGVSTETATRVQELIPEIASELGSGGRTKALSRIMKSRGKATPLHDGWPDFDAEIATHPVSAGDERALQAAASAIGQLRGHAVRTADVTAIREGLKRPRVAAALDIALAHVNGSEARLQLALREQVLPIMFREAIGAKLNAVSAGS